MKEYIQEYINSKSLAWSETSKTSELSRLTTIADYIDGNPEVLWKAIESKGAYTRTTIWTRVVSFYDFLLESEYVTGINPYRKWRNQNAKQFKNVYTKETPKISYNEAKQKILKIQDQETREKALQLLNAGLRWGESFTLQDGRVIGKGNKARKVFAEEVKYGKSYSYFLKQLRQVGLKPHTLRKIRATDLARKGLKEADLCAIFGWNSFQTASSYIAPLNDDELAKYFK